jgi:hypothetical protein
MDQPDFRRPSIQYLSYIHMAAITSTHTDKDAVILKASLSTHNKLVALNAQLSKLRSANIEIEFFSREMCLRAWFTSQLVTTICDLSEPQCG